MSYWCTKCGRNHVRGKIWEDHKEYHGETLVVEQPLSTPDPNPQEWKDWSETIDEKPGIDLWEDFGPSSTVVDSKLINSCFEGLRPPKEMDSIPPMTKVVHGIPVKKHWWQH